MRQSILISAILATLAVAPTHAAEEPAPDWTATANVGFVSDYYFRGISQSWNKPTVQGGFDLTHASGFYAGIWGSGITPNTYPDANTEIDLYAGYNGTFASIDKLGYTFGVYGYVYPGGSWKKYNLAGDPSGFSQTPRGGRWDTYEANVGLSYDWLSAKLSYTLNNWFGAEKVTGWNSSTKGSTYIELNASYPLPDSDLTLVGHLGHLRVSGRLNLAADFSSIGGGSAPSTSGTNATSPDYTDWKFGLTKAFKVGKAEGWNVGAFVVGSNNSSYWGSSGYGGSSFDGGATGQKLNKSRVVVTVGRTF